MKIDVLYFSGCPNHAPAVERVKEALRAEGLSAEIAEIAVLDAQMAQGLKFLGSPSIRVNGLDVEPEARSRTEFGMMCRTYADGRCQVGLPSLGMIRSALREVGDTAVPQAEQPSGGAGTVAVSLAAVGSVLAASSCCLPLFPFMMAAGLAGTSTFLSQIRPYLLLGSIAFIAFGFYQGWRAKQCRRRTSLISSVLLWVSAVFVFVSVFFPQIMANAMASLGAR